MKSWAAFFALLFVCAALIVFAVFERRGEDLLETSAYLVALYAAGCLPWLLTRARFWRVHAVQGEHVEISDVNSLVARWYRNAMVCAFLYGGLVFGCSVDHNAMGESCAPSANDGLWSFGGVPCSLTPTAFLDLASGVGVGLALFQFPILLYWLGNRVLLLARRSNRTEPTQ